MVKPGVVQRYVIVRRKGRPPQVLRMVTTYKRCWEMVAEMYQHLEAHSFSICMEESRHGAEPAGYGEDVEMGLPDPGNPDTLKT